MPNPIPTKAREVVARRDLGFCLRCGAGSSHLHHRRSRRVRDAHTHCPCNLISLCTVCHSSAHAYVLDSMDNGLIVSAYTAEPGDLPLKTILGWVALSCDGSYQPSGGEL